MKSFAKNNTNLVVEICNLNEVGYPLAKTQAELTTIQKLFLLYAYPIFNKMSEENSNPSSNTTASERDEWKQKTKAEIEARRMNSS